jgi:Skp family chaperone for outer membrane proteins
MTRFSPLAAALALAGAVVTGAAVTRAPAAPQQDRPARVAVVNMRRVFNEVQEAKDIQTRIRQDEQRLNGEGKAKAEELQKLKTEGANFRPGSDQYEEWRTRFMKASIQNQAWAEMAKQELDWRVKRQSRDMYDKIAAAVAEYATSNQIDLVLTDHQPALTDAELEKLPVDQLAAVMDRRRIVYASKYADISDAIIAALDAKYKAGGGGQGAVGQAPGGTAPLITNATGAPGNTQGDAGPAGSNLRGNDTSPRRGNNR